jgi:hypothetical protein
MSRKIKMESIVIILSLLMLTSCSKDKITEIETKPFITTDCMDTVKFSTVVMPIIADKCIGCHGDGGSNSPLIKDYITVSENAEDILKTIKADGLPLMPFGGPKLNDSLIQKISCWIQQGKLNN